MEEEMYILIAKSLNREADAAEQQQLEDWLNEDIANSDIYENMKAVWQETDTLFNKPEFDVTAAWENVASETIHKTTEKKTITFRKWITISSAVAALLLIVFAIKVFTTEDWISVTADKKMMVVNLPDNSKVRLEAGSTLKYPKTFSKEHRNVSLQGKAFFDIIHKEEQPFTVDANTVDVSVLGTSFYVTTDDAKATVTVTTGKVAMMPKDHSDKIILTPGNKGIFKDHKFNVVSDTNFVYYQQGLLEFKGVSFANALSTIAAVTNSVISMDKNLSNTVQQQLIEISFRDQQLEKMLDEICLITNTRWKKDKEQYIIYGR
ncbi:FecR domain-containing protein [Taibaiella lutea]|uniref:FecR domain-containing protein n=1 Tax=Taibaiella lutea TaxID=2608001 RepID=A0A5M6CT51_9BACT|nr:FecR domain-containing protein [Taibaiella lutea]KAA5536339.1 FecR domain-containing protein [Taibaiella lutea]